MALKIIKYSREEEGLPAHVLREVSTLKMIDHPNVVRLTEVFLQGSKAYLEFDYLDMDLQSFLDNCEDPLPLPMIKALSFSHNGLYRQ